MKIFRPLVLVLCGLLLVGVQAHAGTPLCPDIENPPAPVCTASPHGLAYADTREEADAAALAQREATQRFEAHFGPASSGLVVLSTTYDPIAARQLAQAHGLGYSQVWLPASAKRQMMSRAMRRAGLDRARIRRATTGMMDRDQNSLRHEIGHAMYAAAFWPDAVADSGQRYGSPAPDWLDEAAAIFMESPESQGARAGEFLAAVQVSPDSIPPLIEFLEMEHPVLAPSLMRQLERGTKSKSGIQMMVSGDMDSSGLVTFYGQSLLVGMFLIETSGDPLILARISAAIADSVPFPDWLADNGSSHGLPPALASLQETWEAWSRALPERAKDAN
ncbi:hypothetical protein ACW7G2_13020 [Luteimonas sp. A277]